MLFGYPKVEAATNWLHECLQAMVGAVHEATLRDDDLPLWPDVIPATHRENLRSRRSLQDRLVSYAEALKPLNEAEHQKVLEALLKQNEIEGLVANEAECERLSDLPEGIHEPLCDLYDTAFRLLPDLDVRDKHEERLIGALGSAMCPFCGCEYFEPGGSREDLDHYLARRVYPYAAANLENLVPMGDKCNQDFKGQVDILFDGAERCTAYFPFGADVAGIDLDDSDPIGDGQQPHWVVRLMPEGERAETWDRVFDIKRRYIAILRREYHGFLREFSAQCRFRHSEPPTDKAELIAALHSYMTQQQEYGLANRAFLKAAVFGMLLKHCLEGNDDLVELLLMVASEGVAP